MYISVYVRRLGCTSYYLPSRDEEASLELHFAASDSIAAAEMPVKNLGRADFEYEDLYMDPEPKADKVKAWEHRAMLGEVRAGNHGPEMDVAAAEKGTSIAVKAAQRRSVPELKAYCSAHQISAGDGDFSRNWGHCIERSDYEDFCQQSRAISSCFVSNEDYELLGIRQHREAKRKIAPFTAWSWSELVSLLQCEESPKKKKAVWAKNVELHSFPQVDALSHYFLRAVDILYHCLQRVLGGQGGGAEDVRRESQSN